jgi:hypothetical protein
MASLALTFHPLEAGDAAIGKVPEMASAVHR